MRFGLDAVIGWVPGIGDAMAAVASCVIVFAAWRRGVAPVTLTRMIANILLETTVLPMADVAFASGFGSVRQFNDTVRTVFAEAPSALRARAKRLVVSIMSISGRREPGVEARGNVSGFWIDASKQG